MEICLLDPVSVIFTPRRFQDHPDSSLIEWAIRSNQTLTKTSAGLFFVRMIYLPSSSSEVWGWARSAFLKRRKYALLGGKEKRGRREVGEANRNRKQKEGELMYNERSMGLVKKTKWVGMKEKYKHLAKSNSQSCYASVTQTKWKCNGAIFHLSRALAFFFFFCIFFLRNTLYAQLRNN